MLNQPSPLAGSINSLDAKQLVQDVAPTGGGKRGRKSKKIELQPREDEDEVENMDAKKMAGLTIIQVPYWWDKTVESISATIHKYRPDIITVCESEMRAMWRAK
jgi:hypothetical protein